MKQQQRCPWPGASELMIAYHDTEWGIPQHDDGVLFEYILLDSFQAGLSWDIIMQKRENFREAFDNFDYKKIAKYNAKKEEELLKDVGIVRNKLKIKATIRNAQVFMEIQKEFGSFDKYLWAFMGNKTKKNARKKMGQMPATSREGDIISKDLQERGFRFFGPVICYAFMQGSGLVNDHLTNCFRY